MPDVVQARFDPGQRRDGDGMWTDDGVPNRRSRTAGNATRGGDRLGLAERAGFEHGEQVVTSDRIRSSTGYNNIDYAVVRDGDGNTELRLHTGGDLAGDEPWNGTNEWTAQLDEDQVRELRESLSAALDEAQRRHREAGDDWGPDEDRIAEGSVGDEWGSAHWSTWLSDGPGGWELNLDASSGATPDGGSDGAKLTPPQVRRLIRVLTELEASMGGSVAAASPATPALATIRNVELARVGSWALSSGQWDPKPQDFAAAVAALNCPAVRAARIRLGHVDPRFDGEPAVGAVANLRVESGGHSLVGDLDKVPGWLPKVISAAYPDRSVEGIYDSTCQLGHRHPFVLTGLALLGVTAPGVGTLRSIEDVGDMFGVTDRLPVAAGTAVSATFKADVAAAGDPERLKKYWTKDPEGLAKWADKPHPWTALYRQLKKHMPDELAKRTASQWYFEVKGHWPGSKRKEG